MKPDSPKEDARARTVEVKRFRLKDLKPAPYNPRRASSAFLRALERSLERFGYVDPILVNETTGHVVGGNQRLRVLKRGGAKEVDAIVVRLSNDEEKALNVALNKVSGDWDEDALATLLQELRINDARLLDVTGFEGPEVEQLLYQAATATPAPALDEALASYKPTHKIRAGEVWGVAGHRLACGDTRDAKTWKKLLAGKKADLVVTSPPYADRRVYDKTTGFVPPTPDNYVAWYAPVAKAIRDHLAPTGSYVLNIRAHCEDGQRLLYTHDLVVDHVRTHGFRFVDDFAWVHGGTPRGVNNRFKNGYEDLHHFAVSQGFKRGYEKVYHLTVTEDAKFRPERVTHRSVEIPDFNGLHPSVVNNPHDKRGPKWEALKAGTVKGKPGKDATTGQGQGGAAQRIYGRVLNGPKLKQRRKLPVMKGGVEAHPGGVSARVEMDAPLYAYPSNVLSLGKNREAVGHAAAFPISLPIFFAKAFTDPGDVVLDPFLGSGTTLLAAHETQRVGYGIELSPKYADMTLLRLEKATGQKAERVDA